MPPRKPYPYPPHPAIIALDDAARRAGLDLNLTAAAVGVDRKTLRAYRNGKKPTLPILRLIDDATERLEALAALAPLPPRRRARKPRKAKVPKPPRPPKPPPRRPTSFHPDPFRPGVEWWPDGDSEGP